VQSRRREKNLAWIQEAGLHQVAYLRMQHAARYDAAVLKCCETGHPSHRSFLPSWQSVFTDFRPACSFGLSFGMNQWPPFLE
jgi:hypothetical protein